MFHPPVQLKSLEEQILAYEREPVETGKILFYGHSLFTRWGSPTWGYRRLDADIRMKDGSLACVNHGFGSASSEEMLYYYDRMIRPWAPRALVLMSLYNDDVYGMSVEQTLANLQRICFWARTDFPGIRFYFVEAHPHPLLIDTFLPGIPDSHNERLNRVKHYNEGLALYAHANEDAQVIRLWNRPELFETPEDTGNPHKFRKELFEDYIHYNQQGYDVFGAIVREALDDIL